MRCTRYSGETSVAMNYRGVVASATLVGGGKKRCSARVEASTVSHRSKCPTRWNTRGRPHLKGKTLGKVTCEPQGAVGRRDQKGDPARLNREGSVFGAILVLSKRQVRWRGKG